MKNARNRFIVVCITAIAFGVHVHAQDSPRDVIEAAVRAQGGKAKLEKTLCFYARIRAKIFDDSGELKASIECWCQPGRSRAICELGLGGKTDVVTKVVNENHAWYKSNHEATEELTGSYLELAVNADYTSYVSRLVPLLTDNGAYVLTLLDETSVLDRPAVVVKAAAKDRPDVKLFFDKKSHLLIKTEYADKDRRGKEELGEEYYTDYKDIKGVLMPMRKKRYVGKEIYSDGECVEMRFLDKIDPAKFAKPD